MATLLSAVLFVSGAAAVAFQTLWFRQAGLVLGNSVWASSIVLASFMGGLALGNAIGAALGDRLRRPLMAFALLECTIGGVGFAVVLASFSLPAWVAPWLRPFSAAPMALDALRLGIAFVLLLVPATAMGMTLPLLVRVLFERRPNFGLALGRLYGWNTLGAMCGAIVGDAFLIEKFGVIGAAAAAAACNVLAALGGLATARFLARPATRWPPVEVTPVPSTAVRSATLRTLLGAAFLSGAIFLALEVVWFRFLTLFIHADSLAFSLLLAVVLCGIGAGGVIAGHWLARDPDAPRFAPVLACACGAVSVVTYARFHEALAPFGTLALEGSPHVLNLAARLMLPSALLTGVLFPLLGAAAKRASDSPARATGRFVLANTLGSATGPLFGGFVLLPWLGMERSFFALAAAYGGVVVLVWGAQLRTLLVPSVACFALVLWFFPLGRMKTTYLRIPVARFTADGSEKVIATREGLTETILYLRAERFGEPRSYRLVTNGFSMSSTLAAARRYMKLFVYLPVALHPDIRRALLISYGVGSTAKALVDTPGIKSIDVVDISRDVLEMSAVAHPLPGENPLRDPRVSVHIEDGRFFLQTTDERFDLITAEPPPPKNAGIGYLYSQEYFQLLHDRLTDGGIATYWLPAHSLYESETKSIIAAFCEAFQDCTLWNGTELDWLLMGSRGMRTAPDEEAFRRQWLDPKVGPEIRSLGVEMPEQLGALFLADAEGLRAQTAGTPPLTDRFPLRVSPTDVSAEEVAPKYRTWVDASRAGQNFERSSWVAHAWPPGLRMGTLPYFRYQQWINATSPRLRDGPPDVAVSMDEVHELLTTTRLEALPLALLGGGDADEMRIVHDLVRRGDEDPAVEMRLGLELLSQRRYLESLERFRASSLDGALRYEALALALAGRDDDARAVVARVRLLRSPREPDRRELAYWRWLSTTFALPDPYAPNG